MGRWVPYVPGKHSYPPLIGHLSDEWQRVEPSGDGAIEYRPCKVDLVDGSSLDCVYVIDAQSYIDNWGIWPEDDPAKQSVAVKEIARISESPLRLPVAIANQLYMAGESGMGYCIFTLRFVDGTEQAYVGGNAIDFVALPEGKSTADIVAVLPHKVRNAVQKTLPYSWCLFGEGESRMRSERRVDSMNG